VSAAAPPARLAAVDVGTNSTRLLVADVAGGAIVAEHTREMVITRLGKGVDATRRLDPAALARTLAVIRGYAETCERLGVEAVRVAGTSAARDARNAEEFSGGVEAILGVRPEVLSGQEEAATSFLGATYDLPGPRPALVFDIGGGSTELMVGRSGVAGVAWARSLDIGSVRLTERHVRGDPLDPAEVTAVRADAEGELLRLVPEVRTQLAAVAEDTAGAPAGPGVAGPDAGAAGELLAPLVVGVAGTVTTVTAVSLDLPAYDPAKVHRSTLGAGAVAATAERLCALTVAEKAALPVMPP
jgi:exopolyphosphatase/guanosine-5'-triphosphate,3'-diphosphate pyrophosphatase